jgi:predicted DNA-binding ribbon-helix-helix protein
MNSMLKKRSIAIGGHRTSISLEDNFWTCLRQIARERATTVSEVIASLDAERESGNLSSAIRIHVLKHYRTMAVASPQRDGEPDYINLATTADRAEGPAIAAENHKFMERMGDAAGSLTTGKSRDFESPGETKS